MFMQAWCCPSSKLPLPSCLFLKGFTSSSPSALGLSLLLKKVPGGVGGCAPPPTPASRPQRWEGTECFSFVSCLELCLLQSGIKALCKVAACPSSRAHETLFQEPVYMVAASVLGSQPPAGTSLFTLPIQPTPFLSSWRWASLSSPQASQAAGRSGSVEFQSTKGTVEAILPVPQLTTNHSPAFQFC